MYTSFYAYKNDIFILEICPKIKKTNNKNCFNDIWNSKTGLANGPFLEKTILMQKYSKYRVLNHHTNFLEVVQHCPKSGIKLVCVLQNW